MPLDPSITLRETNQHDMPMITAIYAHAVLTGTASFEEVPPTLDMMTERWLARQRGGYPDRVAVQRGEVVGYAYAGQYRPRPAYRHTVENSIYVADDKQGLGIGKALLSRIIADCQRSGFKQMIAVVGGKNNTASEKLHLACGFERAGLFKDVGFKLGSWQDTLLMQRAL